MSSALHWKRMGNSPSSGQLDTLKLLSWKEVQAFIAEFGLETDKEAARKQLISLVSQSVVRENYFSVSGELIREVSERH